MLVRPAGVVQTGEERLSIRVSTWATLASLPFGIAIAYLLARKEFWGKSIVNGLVHLPLILPPVVTGYLLLGAVIERVSGETLDAYLANRILGPLHVADGPDRVSRVPPGRQQLVLGALLLALVMALFVARSILNPLRTLHAGLCRVLGVPRTGLRPGIRDGRCAVGCAEGLVDVQQGLLLPLGEHRVPEDGQLHGADLPVVGVEDPGLHVELFGRDP